MGIPPPNLTTDSQLATQFDEVGHGAAELSLRGERQWAYSDLQRTTSYGFSRGAFSEASSALDSSGGAREGPNTAGDVARTRERVRGRPLQSGRHVTADLARDNRPTAAQPHRSVDRSHHLRSDCAGVHRRASRPLTLCSSSSLLPCPTYGLHNPRPSVAL